MSLYCTEETHTDESGARESERGSQEMLSRFRHKWNHKHKMLHRTQITAHREMSQDKTDITSMLSITEK